MQGFDENFLADASLAVDQQGNVFFQQALGLAHGFFHAAVAKMQGVEADRRRCRVCHSRFGEDSGLNRNLLWSFQQALEAIAPGSLKREGQPFRLIE
ncbi:hypothetical protein D3C86_1385720 [compost metagenome]